MESELDPWKILYKGDFHQAIDIFTSLYNKDKNPYHLRGRGKAYILSGEYPSALEDFYTSQKKLSEEFTSDYDDTYIGICYWYLNLPERAIDSWKHGLKAQYTDAAGGVILPSILYYASIRLKDEKLYRYSRGLLLKKWERHKKRISKNLKSDEFFIHPGLFAWPGVVVPYLLELIDINGLKEYIDSDSKILESRHLCQAEFYIGVRALRSGDDGLYVESMKNSIAQDRGRMEAEYYLASWELKNGKV